MLIALFLLMMTSAIPGEVIYTTTETYKLVETDCNVYVTSLWGDNGTPDPRDDRFLGKDTVLDCGAAGATMVPEDLSTLKFVKAGFCHPSAGAKLITYELYKANLAVKQAEINKMSSTVVPSAQEVKPIRVKDIKQD